MYPCFRPSGPIKCPKNKLPMPRDLWYRIVYSQALEQQLGREMIENERNRRKQTGFYRMKISNALADE